MFYNGWTHDPLCLTFLIQDGKVVVDSVFHAGTVDFLVKSAQTVPMGNGIVAVRARAVKQFQSSFPHIKDDIRFETGGE
jgi:hypothetical protein